MLRCGSRLGAAGRLRRLGAAGRLRRLGRHFGAARPHALRARARLTVGPAYERVVACRLPSACPVSGRTALDFARTGVDCARIASDFAGFCRIAPDFNGLHRISPNCAGFYRTAGFCRTLRRTAPGFSGRCLQDFASDCPLALEIILDQRQTQICSTF